MIEREVGKGGNRRVDMANSRGDKEVEKVGMTGIISWPISIGIGRNKVEVIGLQEFLQSTPSRLSKPVAPTRVFGVAVPTRHEVGT